MKGFLVFGFIAVGTFLLPTTISARPQWAYNMASYECDKLRKGMLKDKITAMTYNRFPEYHKYIDEYGVGPLIDSKLEQCPELLSTNISSSGGGSGSNGCRPSNQQIFNLASKPSGKVFVCKETIAVFFSQCTSNPRQSARLMRPAHLLLQALGTDVAEGSGLCT